LLYLRNAGSERRIALHPCSRTAATNGGEKCWLTVGTRRWQSSAQDSAKYQRRQAQESNDADDIGHRGQYHAAGDRRVHPDLAQYQGNNRASQGTGQQIDD
jgi:hypothetical protein